MEIKDAVKAAMSMRGMTQTALAEKIGKKQPSVALYLQNPNGMRVDTLQNMMNACDFDLVIVDRRNRGIAYKIGPEDEITTEVLKKEEEKVVEKPEETKKESDKTKEELSDMLLAFAEWYKQQKAPTTVS